MANPATILNVDHNRVRREANSRLLSSPVLVVHESASGQEALQKVSGINPDVVILMGKLPDIDGFNMCRQLRETPGFGSLILLQDSEVANAAVLNGICGPDAWLPQRCGARPFLSTVHSLLRLRNRLADANQGSQAAAQMLQRCYEETEGFAFQACHDLEEPSRSLHAFRHMIDQAPERLTADENLFLEQALAGTDRLRRLFGNLLSYSQIPRDHKPALRTVDLNLAARAAMFRLSAAVRDSGAQIQVGELPLVSGNLARLQQVFECLLANAMQYRRMDQALVVRIDAQETSDQATISVADNGPGIASQYHHVIFQPFKRLHGRENPGSGMGLAIAKRIVEAHQGRMWVESQPGSGATFFFTLNKAIPDE